MLVFILSAVKIVFLLGLLILIHELGHFLAAKTCKVKVNEFAIGFGPTIWKKTKGETKYALRLIPCGGFVSMEGEDSRSDSVGSYSRASIPKRMVILAAGGLVNIVFALILYFGLGAITGGYLSNKVDDFIPGYVAQKSEIQLGDEILKVNNKKIHLKSDLDKQIAKSNGKAIEVNLKRDNETYVVSVIPTEVKKNYIGVYFGAEVENLSSEISSVYPESPAEKAGIKAKDKIIRVNDILVDNSPYKVVELINKFEGTLTIEVERKNELLKIDVEPEVTSQYYLGVILQEADKNLGNNLYYAFWDTANFTVSIVDNLKMLFTGNVSADQLMGPIGISEMVADTKGIQDYIYILALISLSLGVTNLLPFPPLDGGKIVILLIEAIRKKPLKENIEIGIQTAGFAIIILLSIFVAYNDVLRIF